VVVDGFFSFFFFFFFFLNGAVGVFCLIVRGVCVWRVWLVWLCVQSGQACCCRFGGVVRSGSSILCQDLWWYGSWSSECCLVWTAQLLCRCLLRTPDHPELTVYMSFSRILSNVMTWRWPSTAETCSRRHQTNKNTILWQLCFDGPTHPHLNKTQRGWRTWRSHKHTHTRCTVIF
jgi:hypothetical protein